MFVLGPWILDLSFKQILHISWQMEFKASASKVALYYLTDSESNAASIYLLTGLLIPCSRKTWEGPLNVAMT